MATETYPGSGKYIGEIRTNERNQYKVVFCKNRTQGDLTVELINSGKSLLLGRFANTTSGYSAAEGAYSAACVLLPHLP